MSRVDITANIMVKNEESKIVRCIESIVMFVDEIVIVDTGSSDNTLVLIKELIKKYGEEKIILLFHHWENDFSKIRNYMIENSNGKFILQIDADEFLEVSPQLMEKRSNIIDMLEKEKLCVLSPIIRNTNGSIHNTIPRIFRNDTKYYFVGNVHEELRCKRCKGLNNISIDLVINHDGYEMDAVLSKDKIARNIGLLEKIMEKEPNNLRWQYFWIRENYYAGTDREEIIRYAEKFFINIENKTEYMLVYIILALCYIEIDKFEKTKNIILFLKKNGCEMDACFVELTLILRMIRCQSCELDRVMNEACSVENFKSYLNENADHVKVQMFKLLFSLSRYTEAFCILDEIDYNVKKQSILPELMNIKKKIDVALG